MDLDTPLTEVLAAAGMTGQTFNHHAGFMRISGKVTIRDYHGKARARVAYAFGHAWMKAEPILVAAGWQSAEAIHKEAMKSAKKAAKAKQ